MSQYSGSNKIIWRDGREAFFEGKCYTDNPYENNGIESDYGAREWHQGWIDAQAEDKS